jgi:hypothetical protein
MELDPNSPQIKQEHDDSAELQDQPQDSDEFIEQLSTDVGKVIDGIRRIKRRGDRDMALLNPLEKSLNQIKAALRNLKQNVEIPEVQLEFNEHIKQIVETARAQGRRPNTGMQRVLQLGIDFGEHHLQQFNHIFSRSRRTCPRF